MRARSLGRPLHVVSDSTYVVNCFRDRWWEGWIARGEVGVAFDHDGTASYTEIHIDDESGRRVALDVRPLADAVVVRDAEL